MSSGVGGAWELLVDLSGDVALEAADGYFLGEAFFGASGDVALGSSVADHAGDHEVSERGVRLAIAAPVEAVPVVLAA